MHMPCAHESPPARVSGPAGGQHAMNGSGAQPARQDFWRRVTFWTALGVVGWLFLTCGVVWLARDLDRWTVAQVPAGYWWAAQGAIGGFLIIIVVYCIVMERLEARYLDQAGEAESGYGPTDEASASARHG